MFLVAAWGPGLAGAFMTGMVLFHRDHGAVALIISAGLVFTVHTLVGDEATLVSTAIALVVLSALGALFVERRVDLVAGLLGVALFLGPRFWNLGPEEELILGSVMAVTFALTAAVLFALRGTATTVNKKHRMLFADSPTAVMEEDWSEALEYVRSEYAGPPERIRAFLLAYPAVVRRAVSKAKIVRVNQAAIDLLEASSREELLGPRDGDKVIDENLEAFVDALVSLYEGQPIYETETLGLTARGTPIWIQARCMNVPGSRDADTVLVGLADITSMKARQEAMAELVQAKDEFIAKVSHELRTPLTAVLGLTSALAATESMSDEERVELMGVVAAQAAEMSYIVDDLLVAARAEMDAVTISLEAVDPRSEAARVVENLGLEPVEMPEEMPMVVADPGRLRQIFRNLLTNAQRYGGSHRRVLSGADDHMTWIEVRDDGDGVGTDDTDRIFEPYVTAHEGVRGSVGLGLSVARQLAELMGGSLTYCRDGTETVFRLELPLARRTIGAASHS
jgi:signal transduction histidine kinase